MNSLDQDEKAGPAGAEKFPGVALVSPGYELPPLDDILTDDESRKLILRRCVKTFGRASASADSFLVESESGFVLKTYVVELKIEHVIGTEDDFHPELLLANLVSDGARVVEVRLKGGAPVPFAAPVRVHRIGAPRKWDDDALAEASRALPSVLSEDQKRQRRRAQVAAASRRLRERRKVGGPGSGDL